MWRSSRTALSAPSRSALFTTYTSATSRMPALAAWIPSPMPGASSTTVVSARPATSTSDCPTPTVSIRTTSQPAASSTRSACGVAHASPPRWPAAGHRPDVDAAVGGVVLHPDPVAEQRAAGERRGRVDGEDADPAVARAVGGRPARSWSWTCPRRATPVRPMTGRVARRTARARPSTSRSCGDASSTIEISRATERGSPALARLDQLGDVRPGAAVRLRPSARAGSARRPGRHRRRAPPRRCRRRGA